MLHCHFPHLQQVATELALRLQQSVPDYAQWCHLLADALDLPLSGVCMCLRCCDLCTCADAKVLALRLPPTQLPTPAEFPAALPTPQEHRRLQQQQQQIDSVTSARVR